MAKMLLAKPEDQDLIPGTHTVEGENLFVEFVFFPTLA